MGFSPDSRFPVTFAEKGLLQLRLEGSNVSGVRLAAVGFQCCAGYDGL